MPCRSPGWDRSLGGRQYHVAHPRGMNYDPFPVNSYQAESRRLSRFFRMGHMPGKSHVAPATVGVAASNEFPFTLDCATWPGFDIHRACG
jgi:uncharacterized protein (DUF2126 family)